MKLSQATRANWQRLRMDTSYKLQSGANKTRSKRKIYPLEYLLDKRNIAFVERLLTVSKQKNLSVETTLYTAAYLLLKKHGILNKTHVQQVL